MPKIAILFSGRVDNDITLYNELYNNIIQANYVDFFISHSPTDENIIQEFKDLYKPKKINAYHGSYILNSHIKSSVTNSHNVIKMFRNRLLVYNLFKEYSKENNIKYDIIISTRCDLLIKEKLNLTNIIKHINNNEICIPVGNDWEGGINDQMALGNNNTIKEYLNLYNSLSFLLKNGVVLHPETLLKHYLFFKRLRVYRFKFNYNIARSTKKPWIEISTMPLVNNSTNKNFKLF